MTRQIDDMRCPFCGKRDVEYGLALCSGCHADIRYDMVERDSGSPADLQKIERFEEQAAKAQRDFNNTSWPFNIFAQKRLSKIADEMEAFAKELSRRTNDGVDRRLRRGGTPSIATFTRGDRSIDVTVDIPVNPDVKVDFDVILVAHNGKKMKVTEAVKKVTKLGMGASIRTVDSVPATLLNAVSITDAEDARAVLEAAGATVEVR